MISRKGSAPGTPDIVTDWQIATELSRFQQFSLNFSQNSVGRTEPRHSDLDLNPTFGVVVDLERPTLQEAPHVDRRRFHGRIRHAPGFWRGLS